MMPAYRRDRDKWSAVLNVRLGHVCRFLQDRWGYTLPDDDEGMDDLFILLNVRAQCHRPENRYGVLLRTIGLWAPWIDEDEAQALATRVAANPMKFTSETLGEKLNCDYATRERLGVWQIKPTDLTPESIRDRQRERRRQRDRERKRSKREMQTRAEWLAKNSISRTQPWVTDGISRKTWYKRQKAA